MARTGDREVRRPEDWFPPVRPAGVPTATEVAATVAAALAAIDINTTAPITGGGNLSADRTLVLDGTKAEFNAACSNGDFLFVGDITQYTDEMARDALGVALVAGAGITITPNDGLDTITIAATGGGGSGIDIEDEGVAEATGATILNFVGAGVSAVDVGGGQVDVTIPGAPAGVDVEDEGVAEATAATIFNFTGAGVTATDVGGGQVDIAIPGGGTGWTELTPVSPVGASEVTFTGLSGYNEVLVLARALTASVSGIRLVQLSDSNGASYFSASGDYIRAAADGGVANIAGFGHATASTAARTLLLHLRNLKGTIKFATYNNDINSNQGIFVASANPIDALRVVNSAGGTISGGPIYVLAR